MGAEADGGSHHRPGHLPTPSGPLAVDCQSGPPVWLGSARPAGSARFGLPNEQEHSRSNVSGCARPHLRPLHSACSTVGSEGASALHRPTSILYHARNITV